MSDKRGNILDRIGRTPMVPINRLNPNPRVRILAKLESFNPGGSVKDRAALAMIEGAEERGELNPGKVILEATSGNTGIGLSLVAAVKGYRLLLVMSESVSEERKKILRAMGAELTFTPDHLSTDGAIEHAYGLARSKPDEYWLADQFNNPDNWKAHYLTTSEEIWEQTGGCLDAVLASMGTTGTIMGLSRRLKELHPGIFIVGMEPYMGHKIQGLKNMKESYRPGIFDKREVDRIINVDDDEAYETARRLAREEGILAGMSSGAAMAAALRLASEMESGTIAVIFPDSGERYLSTPLFMDRKRTGLFLYNTLSRKKEEFIPLRENRVSMYVCGPTVCEYPTIAQSRRYVFADLIRRYLTFRGYEVRQVVNVTDLDDRTIQGAETEGMSLKEYTERFFQAFLEDMDRLNVLRATLYPRASDHVEEMIKLAETLVEKGYAYEKFRSIYFDISRFKEYGALSRIDLEKIRLGQTVDLDQYEKVNPRDFTLLKRTTLSELKAGLYYETRWGNVRPSWHLECPAMALKHLGPTYDIHASGRDLVFPHHENTIAISRAATGRPPAKYWLHNELVVNSGEEADSLNTLTIREILSRGYTGREIRYWLINHHYRKPISFSWSKLDDAKNTLGNLDIFVEKLRKVRSGRPYPEVDQAVYDLRRNAVEALDDDLNVAQALAALFRFVRRVNRRMDSAGLAPEDKEKVLKALESADRVLGVLDLEPDRADPQIQSLVEAREKARREKDWETADRIRDELKGMGVEVMDTKDGPLVKRRDRA
ncbi:MAG: cysteine--tRNA ligase [Desulfobacteraceae bacterium]